MEEVRPSPRVFALSLVGLAVFLAWEAVALRSYIRVESRPPAWDQAVHLEIALDYRNAVLAGNWSEVMRLAPKPGMPPFPPLYQLLLRYACGTSDPAGAALWLNWFYLAVLGVFLFAIAWHFRPDETALLAVVIFAGSPAVQDLYHTQLVDLSLAAWAAAAYWALLRSDEFRRWGGSLAFGVLFAVGMMHKWSFFSYLLPAYYVALQALARAGCRLKVLVAALVALAGFAPWYWLHWTILVPRLFQASSDFAVPFWRGGAVLAYLGQMAEGLGPLFFVLSIIGVCIPQYRRNWHRGWVLTGWFVSSYLFWTLVPNRQMRFLVPGLPALAVAGMGAWPRVVVWGLAAVQLFTMANFTAAWVLPLKIPTPWRDVVLFPSQPAQRQDWKIGDILREAERRADPDRPLANLTLVANDIRFNGPNFNWTAKLLKLPHLRIRGVNSRLCEFSQFVLLKDGRLGPGSVIGGLPEAANIIKTPQGWFKQAYEEAGRWPLPDGSAAVLYEQKRPKEPPLKGRTFRYQFYTSGAWEASDLRIELGDWEPARSAYRWARVSAAEMKLRGLRLTGVQAELEGLRLAPLYEGRSNTWGDVRLLKLDKLRVKSFRVNGEALKTFLESRVQGLSISALELDKTLKLRGALRGFSVAGELSAEVMSSPPALRLKLRDVRLGATPVPKAFLGPWRTFTQSFLPTPEMPFTIAVPGLTLADGWLSVP